MKDGLLQDLRYVLRTLRREPGFALFAVLILGLGIGASTTVFSVVNAVLLRPLPFEDPGALVWIANRESEGLSDQTTQVDHMLDLRTQTTSYTGIGAYMAFYGNGDFKLTGGGEPERLSGVPVSQNFFAVLGVQPLIGRTFNDAECRWNGAPAVILTYPFWKRRFNGDPSIVGQKLILDDKSVEVVGVLPASFDFGAVFAPGRHFDIVTPFPLTPETNRWGNTMAMIGRLKPGVSVATAQAELTIVGERLSRAHRADRNNFTGVLSPLTSHVNGKVRPALLVLSFSVGVVMLIVCANLSSLLLGRSLARKKEMAIRAALGAGRTRLIAQTLTESLVLSFAGSLLGLLLAFAGTRTIAHIQALSIPLLGEVRIDMAALAFILLGSLVTGVAFGLLPALGGSQVDLNDSLKDAGRGSSRGGAQAWLRKLIVVAEVAFACMLLIGAGLLVRSLYAVLQTDLGFRPDSAVTIRVDPDSSYATRESQNAYFDEVLRRVREIPGVSAAGITDALPLGRNRTWGIGARGVQYAPGTYPSVFPRIVTEGYFVAMGIPLRSGRDFTARDTTGSEPVIVINETMARSLWPGQDPLGKQTNSNPPQRVIGVVADVRHLALERSSGNEMYLALRQSNDRMSQDLVVRSSLSPAEAASRIRKALEPIEPNLPGKEFRTLDTLVDLALSPRRFIVFVLGGFAAFAVLLSSLGIYAVIAYSVGQRSQELGIRLALGASPTSLERGILGETLALALFGLTAGVVGGWFASRALQSLLYEVKPTDPATFAAAFIILLLVAATAGYLPARRVSRIDPKESLRAA